MQIILNLNKSFNNYHWNNKEELKNYIIYMLSILYEHKKELANNEEDMQNLEDRLYDILDMFTSYEIKE